MATKERKFKLDPGENDRISRIFKVLFGVICIVAAIITAIVMSSSVNVTSGSIIALLFLLLFGIWLILGGMGYTERYVTIADEMITLKEKVYAPARRIKAAEIGEVAFGQMRITFVLTSGEKVILRLGTFYRESSFRLMDAVYDFCAQHGVMTSDAEGTEEGPDHEA